MQKTVFYNNLKNADKYFPQRQIDGDITSYVLFVKHKQTIAVM